MIRFSLFAAGDSVTLKLAPSLAWSMETDNKPIGLAVGGTESNQGNRIAEGPFGCDYSGDDCLHTLLLRHSHGLIVSGKNAKLYCSRVWVSAQSYDGVPTALVAVWYGGILDPATYPGDCI